jgi:hypothetical protein
VAYSVGRTPSLELPRETTEPAQALEWALPSPGGAAIRVLGALVVLVRAIARGCIDAITRRLARCDGAVAGTAIEPRLARLLELLARAHRGERAQIARVALARQVEAG